MIKLYVHLCRPFSVCVVALYSDALKLYHSGALSVLLLLHNGHNSGEVVVDGECLVVAEVSVLWV